MTKAIFVVLGLVAASARADVVDDFSRKSGLSSGGEYKPTGKSSRSCAEGEFSIEADEQRGVLLRMGPEILADGVSSDPAKSFSGGACTTTYQPATIQSGKIDHLKEMDCKVKGLEHNTWRSIFTVAPDGFNYVVTYTNGTHKDCYYRRK